MTILGISCYYHDAAAAIISDGQIIAAADEERFSRIKHDANFPKRAIDFCLHQAGLSANELDWVIFYEKPFLKFERITLSFLATAPFARQPFINAYKSWLKDKLWIRASIANYLKVPTKKVQFCLHHLSHAASAYYTSPFDKTALMTCDGVGEWTTTAWGKALGNKISLDYEVRFPHSLGLFYSTFTQFLGFQVNEGEYKVMGLAPYGKPRFVDQVEKLIYQAADGSFGLNLDYFNFHLSDQVSYNDKFIRLLGVDPVPESDSDQVKPVYADIAASAQQVLEDKLLVIARAIRQKSGEDNLCYAGGVALNGVANWRIFKEAGFKNVYIHPAAGDPGGAVGAALYFYHHVLGHKKRYELNHVYLGASNGEKEIRELIDRESLRAVKLSDSQLEERVVDLLLKRKVVGWARGRFEWGPRALGARSILADPRDSRMKDLVNSKIKFREAFRPFAPVALHEKGADYFDIDGAQNQRFLEFMLAVVPVNPRWQSKLRAITHVDGTARPQLLKKGINDSYFRVIKKFGQTAGVSALLNTSFNLKGEPIVNSAEEAYATFLKSGLDALVLENYLLKK